MAQIIIELKEYERLIKADDMLKGKKSAVEIENLTGINDFKGELKILKYGIAIYDVSGKREDIIDFTKIINDQKEAIRKLESQASTLAAEKHKLIRLVKRLDTFSRFKEWYYSA